MALLYLRLTPLCVGPRNMIDGEAGESSGLSAGPRTSE